MTQVTDADVLEFASLRTGNDIEDLDEDEIADAERSPCSSGRLGV